MALIALTTTFRPPASCFNNVYTSQGDRYVKDVSITSSKCYPSAFRSLFTAAIPYSPGICPAGYSYGSTTPYGDDATAALCCPLGMTAIDLGCNSQVNGATQLYVGGSTVTVDQAVLAVHGVYIAWSSGDQPVSSAAAVTSSNSAVFGIGGGGASTPTPVGSTTIMRSTSARSASATSASSTPISPADLQPASPASTVTIVASHIPTAPPTPPRGLSTGAKAGIGVGASLAGMAIVAAAVWFVLSRKKKRSEENDLDNQLPMYDDKTAQAMASKSPHISELSGDTRRSELLGAVPWMEVQSKGSRAELEGRSDL